MLIRIGQAADHGFDEPIGLLSDCHRRIERFLAMLATVADVRRGSQLTDADRRALEAALQYFETAAPRHTADEEESLFPRLRATTDPAARAAFDAVQRLEADHRVAEEHHNLVSRLGRQWLSNDTLSEQDARALRQSLDALAVLYREHIAIEENQLFASAAHVLTAEELEAVGREMAARRGVAFTPSRTVLSREP